jgi:hypothetical protein
MDLIDLVKIQIVPLMEPYSYKTAEEYPGFLRLTSPVMEVRFSRDPRDYYKSVGFNKLGGFCYELNDTAIAEVFDSDLKIDQVSTDTFIQTIVLLFQHPKGIALLQGDITALERSILRQHDEYTRASLLEQKVKAVDTAWQNKEYAKFLDLLEKIDPDDVPGSYLLKYKIALKSLKK